MRRALFTMVVDFEQDPEGGKLIILSANWTGLEPESALTLLNQVVIDKKVQEALELVSQGEEEVGDRNSVNASRGANSGAKEVAREAKQQNGPNSGERPGG